MSGEEWGPWIEHNGMGCSVVGKIVMAEVANSIIVRPDKRIKHYKLINDKTIEYMPLPDQSLASWRWYKGANPILRYRVKKPKGLTMLQELLQNLPTPVKESLVSEADMQFEKVKGERV